MNFLKRARSRYILHRYAIKHELWVAVTGQLQLLQSMSSVEKAHLRELSTLKKSVYLFHDYAFSSRESF